MPALPLLNSSYLNTSTALNAAQSGTVVFPPPETPNESKTKKKISGNI